MKHRKGDALHPNNLSLPPNGSKTRMREIPRARDCGYSRAGSGSKSAGDRDSDPRYHQDRVFLWFM
jgi:hypothetical protein